MKRVAAQTRIELLLTLRRGESLLVVAGVPVAILVFFSSIHVLPGAGRTIDFLVPGIIALSIIASAMTSLGIATGFERHAGVLRRLGTTPLGRSGLFIAKAVALAAVVVFQVAVVSVVGTALGWHPHGNAPLAAGVVLLGTTAFAAMGFALAGTLRAETNLAVANALFVGFLLLGGVIVPVSSLPDALGRVARILPAAPFAGALRAAVRTGTVATSDLVVLAGWAVVTALLAVRRFRWD